MKQLALVSLLTISVVITSQTVAAQDYSYQDDSVSVNVSTDTDTNSTDTTTTRNRVRVRVNGDTVIDSLSDRQAKRQELSDERKQRILEHIEEVLAHINERWTTHFANVLERLDLILAKIEERVGETEAVAEAHTAIDEAMIAVEEQAAKVYVVEFDDETQVRESAKEAIDALKADLRTLREVVFSARDSVHDAFEDLSDTNDEE